MYCDFSNVTLMFLLSTEGISLSQAACANSKSGTQKAIHVVIVKS